MQRTAVVLRRGLVAALLLTAGASAQTPLPKGLNLSTDEPVTDAVMTAGQTLALNYRKALNGAVKFPSESVASELSFVLVDAVEANGQFEANTRIERASLANEIRAIEASPELRTPYGHMRLRFLFGQFEQIMTNAPLEPIPVYTRVAPLIPEEQRLAGWQAILRTRERFVEIAPADLSPLERIAPGTPGSRSQFVLYRHRAFEKAGLLTPSDALPEETESAPDAIKIALPEYYRPAPPIETWIPFATGVAKRYEFRIADAAAALQIARDVTARATAYRESMKEDYAKVAQFKDATQRAAQMWELDRGVDGEYEQLKFRLAGLIPADKRPGVTSRPAAPQTDRKMAPPVAPQG